MVVTECVINVVVSSNLGLKAGEIELAHTVGRRKADPIRPIVVKLLNSRDNIPILKNASKINYLPNSRAWIE